jgi:general stress protein YciG
MNDSELARNAGERRERRGFASMSPEKQREIASKGGQISRGGRGRLVDGPGSEASEPPYRAEYNTPVNPERFGE